MERYNKEVLNDLEKTAEELLHTFSSFNKELINQVPFERSWTAGQVGEHLLKSNVMGVLFGKVKKTERNPAEKIEPISDVFLNFNFKMTNPDFNTPTQTEHNRENVLSSLQKMEQKIIEASKTLDLSETCLDFELPGFGELTRLEWIYFSIFHTQRHTHQLKNIFQKINQQLIIS
ncbi:MAG TPA: DinB family protein [Ignavibacteria bacterium]|jgi:hypothetical protein